ncbi:MAG: extracellular solute-binding protein [Nocardioides sp.]
MTTPDVAFYQALAKDFEAQNPGVKVTIDSQDYNALATNAPRILSGSNPPDIIKLGSFGTLAKDNLIRPLDGYAKAYGWDRWSQSQFDAARLGPDGLTRGEGQLYGVGPGFGVTGVYVNQDLAAKIGMASPPASLDEFESDLAKAKAHGILPIMSNGKDGGTAFLLQNLQMDYARSPDGMRAWVFNQKGASLANEATTQAATTLQDWSTKGYLPSDVNDIDQTAAPGRFAQGEGLFFPSGNWQAPALDQTKGNFGFFLFPPLATGGQATAMTAGSNLAIPTGADNPDAAGAFLNFVQTSPKARQLTLTMGGLVPAGPKNGSQPTAPGVVGDTVTAFARLVADDGLVDFMANASASIQVNTIVPNLQLLLAGRESPGDFVAKLQDGYAHEAGS